MTEGWQSKPFEECIAKVDLSAKIQRKEFLDRGAYPVVSQEADFINGYWNRKADLFKVASPVVVFGDHTQVLKYVDFDFVLGADGVKVLQPHSFLDPKFFYYQLKSVKLESLGYARHYRLLKNIEIGFPPLPEQQRIVGILDEAFEGIAKARANAEKNLANARELVGSYLADVFSNRDRDWIEKPLKDLCEFENGDRGTNYPNKSARTATGIPFINAGHLTEAGLDFDSMDYISRERFKLLGAGKVQPGDILFCLRGSLGKYASVGDLKEGAIASSLVIVRPSEAILPDLVLAYFRSHLCAEMILKFANGAAQPNLSSKNLGQFIVPVPPMPKQRGLVELIGKVSEGLERLEVVYEKKARKLNELKMSVLDTAFTGQL